MANNGDEHKFSIVEEIMGSEKVNRLLPAVRETQKATALQTIARDITRLTWREAEHMSKGIASKLRDQNLAGLTAALQDWAWEWETFREEERPKP
jgi:hypothetical protein